jgi:hypothetical protein
MGKGNDPNCGLASAMLAAEAGAPSAADEVLVALTATLVRDEPEASAEPVKRHAARGKRKVYTDAEKAEYREKTKAAVAELSEQVTSLADHPERMREWMASMAKGNLWNYSYNNLTLASLQAEHRDPPINVTRLAAFSRWKQLGYVPREGEKGLKVLTPVPFEIWQDKRDPVTGKPVINPKTGKPFKEKSGRRGLTFKVGHIWDISQVTPRTDKNGNPLLDRETGLPLAKELISDNRVEAEQATRELSAVAEAQGVKVFIGGADDPDFRYRRQINGVLASKPSADGFFTELKGDDGKPLGVIVTRAGLSPEQTARVLAHELAHASLHAGSEGYKDHEDRERKEVEAEGTAFVLASFYGLSTEGQANYVAHWARGKEEQRLKDATANIQKAVKSVLGQVEEMRWAAQGQTA